VREATATDEERALWTHVLAALAEWDEASPAAVAAQHSLIMRSPSST
jgi:hypothetical protein